MRWLLVACALMPLAARAQQEPQIKIVPAKPAVTSEQSIDDAQAAALLKRLEATRKALEGVVKISTIDRVSLHHEQQRLEGLLRARRRPCNPSPEVRRLERGVALVAAGEALHVRPGLHRLAYRSPLDLKQHGFVVYVPRGYDCSRAFPLVVMLHGMMSTPMRAVGRLFGLPDDELTTARLRCDRPQLGDQPALVVAPSGFGDALYRGPAAQDVRTLVRRMTRLYRVDRRRITITGLSMGGTGAVELALQEPHLYAGVLALCGYYDRRLDTSTRGQPLLSWERHLQTVHSPVDWAPNGRGLPLVLIHGTLDGPARARSLEQRYKQLGYPVSLELYKRGHNVWVPGYKDGRAFKILGKLRRGRTPKRVSLVTARSRIRRAHWVLVQRFIDHRRWARVEAGVKDRTHVVARTQNVAALRLDLPAAYLARGQPVELLIDGDTVTAPASRARWSRRVSLARAGGKWSLAAGEAAKPAGLVKRPGLAGPIEDVYNDPVVVVYGTGGGQARVLRSVAKVLASVGKRVTLRYPMMADRRFSARRARGRTVILVGNEQTNSVLARLGDKLPIRVTADGVRLGGKKLSGTNIGATFVYPNPEAPSWYLRVVGGTTPRSYGLLNDLPRYMPDYLVYDDRLAVKGWRHLPVLGKDRAFVAGGYFDERWQLPRNP